MYKKNLLKSLMCSALLLLVCDAYATLATCPSVNDLQISRFETSFPYGYDIQTKSMKIFAIAKYSPDASSRAIYDFMIYPIAMASGENLVANFNTTVMKLKSETNTPLTYQINDEDGSVSVCVYTLPGDTSTTALLIADEYYDDDDYPGIRNTRREHVSQLMSRQLIFK